MTKQTVEKLPNALIAALYKNSLVYTETIENTNQEVSNPISKEILFIAKCERKKLDEQQSNFLSAIIKACKLKDNDFNIITNVDGLFGDYTELASRFSAKKIILFGVGPVEIKLPMHFPPYQLQSFEKTTYLSSPSLEELEADKAQKLNLWHCLQKLFS